MAGNIDLVQSGLNWNGKNTVQFWVTLSSETRVSSLKAQNKDPNVFCTKTSSTGSVRWRSGRMLHNEQSVNSSKTLPNEEEPPGILKTLWF